MDHKVRATLIETLDKIPIWKWLVTRGNPIRALAGGGVIADLDKKTGFPRLIYLATPNRQFVERFANGRQDDRNARFLRSRHSTCWPGAVVPGGSGRPKDHTSKLGTLLTIGLLGDERGHGFARIFGAYVTMGNMRLQHRLSNVAQAGLERLLSGLAGKKHHRDVYLVAEDNLPRH